MKINKTQALELLKKAGIPAKYRADVLHTLPHDEQFCGGYQTVHLFDREAVKKAAETFVIPTEPEFAPGNRVVFTVDLQEEDWFSDDVFSVKAGDHATVIGWEKGKIAVRDYETDRRWDVEPNQIMKKAWKMPKAR